MQDGVLRAPFTLSFKGRLFEFIPRIDVGVPEKKRSATPIVLHNEKIT